jgi:hypothetical protein
MSAILQVIGRELRVRALMPATGAATAVAILIAGWLVSGGERFREVAETSVFFALFFLLAGGLLMGALLIARDLEGNRSLFWLARPIGVWTAFGGKMVAALILVIATTLLVALPAIIVAPEVIDPQLFSGSVALAVVCIALGASLGLLLRNRSAWFLAAAAILIAFGAGVWLNVEDFFGNIGGLAVAGALMSAAVVALTLALIVGHGIAFSRARHDARRQARTFTLVLAVILGVALILSWSFGAWLKSLDLEDFDAVFVNGSAGNVLAVEAYRDNPIGWYRSFVVDLQNGTSVPLATGASEMAVSSSGAFYSMPTSVSGSQYEIETVDFGTAPRRKSTGIVLSRPLYRLATPADGSRVAVVGANGTQVFDPAGKSLGSFAAADDEQEKKNHSILPIFLDRDRLRLYEARDGGATLIRDVDLRSRSIRDAGTLPGRVVAFAPGNERVVIIGQQRSDDLATTPSLSLHDAASGARSLDFPPNSRGAIPLVDGTWATVVRGDGSRLVRVDDSGKILSSVPFTESLVVIGSEVRPGIVWFSERPEDSSPEDPLRDIVLVDVSSGTIVKRIQKAMHVRGFGHGARLPAPGSSEARLISKDGALHAINPDTLEPERLVLK